MHHTFPLVLVLFGSLGLALVDEWKKHIFFVLYTRNGQVNLTDSTLGEIDTKKPTKFLFHGFWSNGFGVTFQLIKDEYLRKVDCNFIIGDWSGDALGEYISTIKRMDKNGHRVAELIVHLHDKRGLRLSDVHLIGHSLGAQMSGVAGRMVQELVGAKVKRITALDAARPKFENGDFQCISKNDAEIVEAIHTDGGRFGVEKPVGTVDFFPNGGVSVQPTCKSLKDLSFWQLTAIVKSVGCSHSKSKQYLALSINNQTFEGRKCASWKAFQEGKCNNNMKIRMGEEYEYSKQATGSVYLKITT